MEYALVYAMMNKNMVYHSSQEVYFKERQTDRPQTDGQTDGRIDSRQIKPILIYTVEYTLVYALMNKNIVYHASI